MTSILCAVEASATYTYSAFLENMYTMYCAFIIYYNYAIIPKALRQMSRRFADLNKVKHLRSDIRK